jgi:hypothetical protein
MKAMWNITRVSYAVNANTDDYLGNQARATRCHKARQPAIGTMQLAATGITVVHYLVSCVLCSDSFHMVLLQDKWWT